MNLLHGIEYEKIGYYVEYMVNGKYYGSINIEEKDRETVGYCGRQYHIATEDIVFSNKKRIKKGMKYYTHLYPLCGRSNFNPKNIKTL